MQTLRPILVPGPMTVQAPTALPWPMTASAAMRAVTSMSRGASVKGANCSKMTAKARRGLSTRMTGRPMSGASLDTTTAPARERRAVSSVRSSVANVICSGPASSTEAAPRTVCSASPTSSPDTSRARKPRVCMLTPPSAGLAGTGAGRFRPSGRLRVARAQVRQHRLRQIHAAVQHRLLFQHDADALAHGHLGHRLIDVRQLLVDHFLLDEVQQRLILEKQLLSLGLAQALRPPVEFGLQAGRLLRQRLVQRRRQVLVDDAGHVHV